MATNDTIAQGKHIGGHYDRSDGTCDLVFGSGGARKFKRRIDRSRAVELHRNEVASIACRDGPNDMRPNHRFGPQERLTSLFRDTDQQFVAGIEVHRQVERKLQAAFGEIARFAAVITAGPRAEDLRRSPHANARMSASISIELDHEFGLNVPRGNSDTGHQLDRPDQIATFAPFHSPLSTIVFVSRHEAPAVGRPLRYDRDILIRMSRPVISRLAPAKLNLALSVGPPGPDGMHPICSWMVPITLADELTVTRLEDDRLSRYAILWHEAARRRTEIDWSIRQDLAVRAHLALEQAIERRLPVQVKLEKQIPVGGGLGGGSSDAAAMLLALHDLFELDLSRSELAAIAVPLGSDVPFFISERSAIIAGRGEQVEPLEEAPELHAVVVFPDLHCPTGAVYQAYDELGPGPLRETTVREFAESCEGTIDHDGVFNDLTEAAIRTAPPLAEIRDRLTALAERTAHLTGSGSSFFILCDDALHAEALAGAIERELDLPAASVSQQNTERPSRRS